MKKILTVILVLLTNLSIVDAGRSLPLNFEEQTSYIIPLYEKDRVVFDFDGDSHSIVLDEIKERRVEFDVFIYQERNKKIKEGEDRDAPIYAFADTVNLLKFDLNRDKIYDFKLDVLDFDQKKALIELTKTDETKEGVIGSPINSNPEKKSYIYNPWIWGGTIALFLIIIFGILLSKVKKDKTWSYH